MFFRIIADSSCDIFKIENQSDNIYFNTVPFVITVDGTDYVDNEALNVRDLVTAMAASSKSHTSCPSPHDWMAEFGEEGDVFAVTISSNLSGSYNSACAAKQMVLENDPDRNIEILDSRGTGPSLNMLGHLGLWGVGIASDEGTIKMKKIAKGGKRTLQVIMHDLKDRVADKGVVVISHCENELFAHNLKEAVISQYPDYQVKIMPTRGLCSYYAEKGGIIVGF